MLFLWEVYDFQQLIFFYLRSSTIPVALPPHVEKGLARRRVRWMVLWAALPRSCQCNRRNRCNRCNWGSADFFNARAVHEHWEIHVIDNNHIVSDTPDILVVDNDVTFSSVRGSQDARHLPALEYSSSWQLRHGTVNMFQFLGETLQQLGRRGKKHAGLRRNQHRNYVFWPLSGGVHACFF